MICKVGGSICTIYFCFLPFYIIVCLDKTGNIRWVERTLVKAMLPQQKAERLQENCEWRFEIVGVESVNVERLLLFDVAWW